MDTTTDQTATTAPATRRHPVAVTVFLDADGRDPLDAHQAAEIAVREALAAAADDANTLTMQTHAGYPKSMRVLAVMGAGAAVRNGYLTMSPDERRFAEFAGPDID